MLASVTSLIVVIRHAVVAPAGLFASFLQYRAEGAPDQQRQLTCINAGAPFAITTVAEKTACAIRRLHRPSWLGLAGIGPAIHGSAAKTKERRRWPARGLFSGRRSARPAGRP